MKPTFEYLSNELKKKNIRLSHHRVKVLEYLTHHQCHPTVEQIFNELQKEVPTLSKTTIYNTLNTLVQTGLVRVISIEENETRYDIITDNHGHFKCETCGTIYNFEINIDSFETKELDQFKIRDKSVYFKGICSKCLVNIKEV